MFLESSDICYCKILSQYIVVDPNTIMNSPRKNKTKQNTCRFGIATSARTMMVEPGSSSRASSDSVFRAEALSSSFVKTPTRPPQVVGHRHTLKMGRQIIVTARRACRPTQPVYRRPRVLVKVAFSGTVFKLLAGRN